MSYARFDEDCNVYIYKNWDNVLECCGCNITDGWFYYSASGSEFLEHLRDHQTKGDLVPDYVFESIEDDIKLYGDDVENW